MPVMNDYEATAAIRSLLGAWDKQTGNIERGFCYDVNFQKKFHLNKIKRIKN